LEDVISNIVDWDQVKDGNSARVEEAKALIRQAFLAGRELLADQPRPERLW
jgi:hypothetical protein